MRRLLVALLLVGVATFVVRGGVPCGAVELPPACYVALTPGPTEDAGGLVEIGGAASYASAGELRLTTVAVEEELGLGDWLRATVTAGADAVPRTVLFPADADREEVTRQNAALMVDSQLAATVAALRHAGYEVPDEFVGARVEQLLSETAAERLEVGDVIVSVAGEPTTDSEAVARAVGEVEPGATVEVELRRDGEHLRRQVTVGASPDEADEPMLGVVLTSHVDLPLDVTIDAGVIGGPSAGLMFALSIVDLLDPEDLTGGRVVAGTGSLEADGTVGAVGGVAQKVVGAAAPAGDQRPASVFLVPAGNEHQVRDLDVVRDLLVVPVATLEQALDAVATVAADGRPSGAFVLAGQD